MYQDVSKNHELKSKRLLIGRKKRKKEEKKKKKKRIKYHNPILCLPSHQPGELHQGETQSVKKINKKYRDNRLSHVE